MEEKLLNEIFNENISDVEDLIKSGVDINYIGENGDTPLLVAVETQNYELVKILLQNKADPNSVSRLPSLHAAIDTAVEATKNNDHIKEDSTQIIELLLEYGANPNLTDFNGKTAYQFAKGYHLPAERLLQSKL